MQGWKPPEISSHTRVAMCRDSRLGCRRSELQAHFSSSTATQATRVDPDGWRRYSWELVKRVGNGNDDAGKWTMCGGLWVLVRVTGRAEVIVGGSELGPVRQWTAQRRPRRRGLVPAITKYECD